MDPTEVSTSDNSIEHKSVHHWRCMKRNDWEKRRKIGWKMRGISHNKFNKKNPTCLNFKKAWNDFVEKQKNDWK